MLQQTPPEGSLGQEPPPTRPTPNPQNATVSQLSEEEKRWLSLLRGRPGIDDTTSMMAWVGQVLDHANAYAGASSEDTFFESMPDVSDVDLETLEGLNVFFGPDDTPRSAEPSSQQQESV